MSPRTAGPKRRGAVSTLICEGVVRRGAATLILPALILIGLLAVYGQASAQDPGDRKPDQDFDTLIARDNDYGRGIWSDGTTIWVTDHHYDRLYAYDLATGTLADASKDFNTLGAAGNDSPIGIWSDDTTMWVADIIDDKLYAYNLSTKARDSGKDFDTLKAAGNHSPNGIWSNGITMWVADNALEKLYAYNLSTKARDSSKDFDTLKAAGNNDPTGIWSDGTTMWVADNRDDKLYAYNLSTKARDSTKDFDTYSAGSDPWPTAIWSNGTTMWVIDYEDDKLYAYKMSDNLGDRHSGEDISFHKSQSTHNDFPNALGSDGTTMWVANQQGPNNIKLYAYKMSDKSRDSLKDIDIASLNQFNNNPQGIWADNTTIWVSNRNLAWIFAYKISDKSKDSPKNFSYWKLNGAGNSEPRGIWSDGETMWVADNEDDKIYAYKMSNNLGDRDSDKDFDTLSAAGNNDPRGIWSDGATMWVVDHDDRKLYAYKMSDKSRDSSKDFHTLSAAGNNHPTGIWSIGTTMWVANNDGEAPFDGNHKIYAYRAFDPPTQNLRTEDEQTEYVGPRVDYGNPTAWPQLSKQDDAPGRAPPERANIWFPARGSSCEKDDPRAWPQPALAVAPDPARCGLIELPAALREQLDKPLVGRTALAVYASVRRESSNQSVREAKIEEGFSAAGAMLQVKLWLIYPHPERGFNSIWWLGHSGELDPPLTVCLPRGSVAASDAAIGHYDRETRTWKALPGLATERDDHVCAAAPRLGYLRLLHKR